VIGVAPQGFTGPDMFRVDAWVPLSLLSPRSIPDWPKTWYTQWHQIVVRLKPGVRPADAAADINTAYHRAYTGEDSLQMRATMRIAPIRFGTDGDEPAEVGVTRWLVGVAAVMLLIGCANIVNLLLARAVRRKREVAVRLALGVRRARLVRMLLTESAVLALAGWGAGLGVAYGAGSLIRTVLLPSVDWTVSPVSGRVLVVSLLVTLIAGTCVGLVPALQSSRIDLNAALKASARDGGGRTSKIRGTLTVAQAALSVLLLIGAGLFVRSLRHVNAIDLGIEPDRVLTVGLRRSAAANAGDSIAQRLEAARRVNFLPEAVRRLRAVPLVETATLAIGMPFRGRYSLVLKVSGRDSIPPTPGGSPTVSAIGDDYFRAVGQRLLRGRLFTPADRAGSELVAIVNEEMARTLWPGRDAIGECIRYGSKQLDTVPCSRVVGVVANAHLVRLQEPVRMQYYVPFGQEHGMTGTTLIVRPRGDVGAAKRAIERELRLMDSSLGFIDMRVLQETIDPQVRPWRLGATMFTLMGLLALIVAAVGLYSVMAYLVVQRTHEIGVRSALGASAADIVALILKGGLSLAAIGVGLGVVAALALGRFIAPLLFQTSPRDGLVFTVVAASLLTVAVLATAIPAWRAKRVSPLQALRSD
ncbi:MAG TPA: FtsX-like permease family protein, partial [Gemmatimonadaceae bacterium]|nr:FtsX-like permease family protein [Gemmatimonadaceae bacterium]